MKTWIMLIAVFFVGVIMSLVAIAFVSFRKEPAPIYPTKLSTLEYSSKMESWNNDYQFIAGTISKIVLGQYVSANDRDDMNDRLESLRADVHETIPPVVFETAHVHLVKSIDYFYDAVKTAQTGDLRTATMLMRQSNAEMKLVIESIPTPVNI